ncbi:hypothetical protein B0H14DRAFT_3160793 [Mycena olivaceomarginata]|nr:hypothetical protein B0H14DRAFT_3160793 [Mycena olivaceomarginata]
MYTTAGRVGAGAGGRGGRREPEGKGGQEGNRELSRGWVGRPRLAVGALRPRKPTLRVVVNGEGAGILVGVGVVGGDERERVPLFVRGSSRGESTLLRREEAELEPNWESGERRPEDESLDGEMGPGGRLCAPIVDTAAPRVGMDVSIEHSVQLERREGRREGDHARICLQGTAVLQPGGLGAAPNSKYGGTPQELDTSKLLMELICGVNSSIVLAATE